MKKKRIITILDTDFSRIICLDERSIEDILPAILSIEVSIGETENLVDFIGCTLIYRVVLTPEETRELARNTTKPIRSEVLD